MRVSSRPLTPTSRMYMPRAPTVRISVGFGSDRWTEHCAPPPRPAASSSQSAPPSPPSPPSSQASTAAALREALADIAKLRRKVSSLRHERDEARAKAKAAKGGSGGGGGGGGGVDRAQLRRSIKRALRKTHPDKREPISNAEMTVLLNDLLELVPS